MPSAMCKVELSVVPSIAVALLLAASLIGCGTTSGTSSNSSKEVIARVGDAAIYRAEVDHWASAIGRGNSVGTVLGKASGTPRERALKFLIASSWIIGEAEEQGLSISNAAVERGLQEKIAQAPGGRSEFQEELASTGQTLGDVKREVKSALAVAALRDAVAKRVPPISATEVRSYYAHHRRSFYLPDRRLVDLIEQIPGYADAVALGRQLGPGAPFAKRAIRELVRRETPAEAANRRNGQLVQMIFAATPGRVAGPAIFNGQWVIAVVRKLIPAEIQPLRAVRGELSKTLIARRRKQALNRFAAAYARKWTARTSCRAGYVVQKCSEYRGGRAAERNPLTGHKD
jgi:foldase protein PrsA